MHSESNPIIKYILLTLSPDQISNQKIIKLICPQSIKLAGVITPFTHEKHYAVTGDGEQTLDVGVTMLPIDDIPNGQESLFYNSTPKKSYIT
jgi:hypothetical protein